jgi:glycosyltransferase involved in cell wall biosynthesis
MSEMGVLIPALNCASTIEVTVRGALAETPLVLVVDDGSTDDTAGRAAAAGATVMSHRDNLGKGAALATGLGWMEARGVRRVVTMDGDGQHLASQIPVLMAAADEASTALIVGARQVDTQSVAPIKLFGNRFANRWVEIACGTAIADTQSGFRVYPLPETTALGVRARRFGYETEVLIRAVRAGIAIRSVPVRVYYPPIDERVSHFRPVVDTIRIIFVVLGLIFRLW